MQELTATEIEDVAGGLSIYYEPPAPPAINLGDCQAPAPGTDADPTSWDWNV